MANDLLKFAVVILSSINTVEDFVVTSVRSTSLLPYGPSATYAIAEVDNARLVMGLSRVDPARCVSSEAPGTTHRRKRQIVAAGTGLNAVIESRPHGHILIEGGCCVSYA